MLGTMILSMAEIDAAVRASWAADTCSDDDAARTPWTAGNPAWGHCDVTALVLHDLLGGDLMVGEVYVDGEQHGYHWWNRLGAGVEVDLTREQFQHDQIVTPGRVVTRPPGPPRRRRREYELLRRRVLDRLAASTDGSAHTLGGMSARLDPRWRVLASPSTPAVDRCVDIFARPEGTFGFEEFRRDPEDVGAWTPVAYYSQREFPTEAAALAAARAAVPWLAGVLDG